MSRPPEYEGRAFLIQCLELGDGSCPAGEFLDGLDPSDRRKLDVLFEMLGNHGRISNREKFKKLQGSEDVWEFKSYQIRLLCFFAPGKCLLLTNGVIKQADKLKHAVVERAEKYRRWYMSQEGR